MKNDNPFKGLFKDKAFRANLPVLIIGLTLCVLGSTVLAQYSMMLAIIGSILSFVAAQQIIRVIALRAEDGNPQDTPRYKQ